MKYTIAAAAAASLLAGVSACGPKPAPVLCRDDVPLDKRAGRCGPGLGFCPSGECCSEAGFCGSGENYCAGSQCQLDYCDSCDTFFGPLGSCTDDIPRPRVGSVPYGEPLHTCVQPGMMALTFDDGPYLYTADILDLLDELEVTASFFIAGNNRGKGHIDDPATGWTPILERMHAAGHHIASHTWTHRDLNEVNATIRRSELVYNEMAFRNIFGWFPAYVRAPYLNCEYRTGCVGLLDDLGYHNIDVNVDTKDFEYNDPALIQNAKDRFSRAVSSNAAQNSYIVLAHDVQQQTVTNLTAYMVREARARGYRLVTVGECLGDPKENWYRDAPKDAEGSCNFPLSPGGSSPTSAGLLSSSSAAAPSAVASASSAAQPSTLSTATATATAPAAPSGVKISRDQKCGGNTGNTCVGSGFGDCCSHYGFW
jgi:peptidoglycan/xylan/chitin deacetylase (PgdA/CDA1 family)